ncbi:formylglycine-generating enzyme family protein [Methanolobus bombayensis]|uniref:formylglycine-generating enzyme family protein n=1 Tax=Methanolobus bombayensis TaxID=38023 RepID=UPI001AE34F9E|nr:formylglycine-generating enzyme family protein [Methanolobus bombayensis]MBP1908494.1 formylglycine-generating enzyme required for sulfatase activity [Methanolobus bombayensis]
MDSFDFRHKKDEHIRNEHGNTETNKPDSVKNSIGMEFVLIPVGDFWMYSNTLHHKDPVHRVTISKPFYLGKYQVTQEQWEIVMGEKPSCFEGNHRPVECVSWNDVQEFIKKLNSKETSGKYRLPSESEWEYACRAGTNTLYSFGDSDIDLSEYAWYYSNSYHKTHPVGQKKPNSWGLHDMHGNVWEWCLDENQNTPELSTIYKASWVIAGISGLALRGGGWINYADKCRASSRSSYHSDYGSYSVGFRLLMSL